MIQVEKRAIGNLTVEFFQMDVRTAITVLTRLTKLVGEPMGIISGSMKDKGESSSSMLDFDITSEGLQAAAKAFVTRLDENEFYDTVEKLVSPLHIQAPGDEGTRPVKLDRDFRGKIGLLFKVVYASLEVNYADFLDESGVLGMLGKRATKSEKLT